MNSVTRFFALRDAIEAGVRDMASLAFDEASLLANPPATSSESGQEAARTDPAAFGRLCKLHAAAVRAGRAAGPFSGR